MISCSMRYWLFLVGLCLCVCLSVRFRPAPEVEKSRADKAEKWGHDLYNEEEQKPREKWEKEKVISLSLSLLKQLAYVNYL